MDCFNAAYLVPVQHLPPSWYLSCLHIENSMIWYDLVHVWSLLQSVEKLSHTTVVWLCLTFYCERQHSVWEWGENWPHFTPHPESKSPPPLPGTIQLYPPQRDRGITPLLLGGIISHPPQIKTQVTTGNSCKISDKENFRVFRVVYKRQRNPLTTEGSWLEYPGKTNTSS